MAGRKVIWTKTADIQFSGILEYWFDRNQSATYSKRLIEIVSQKTNQIAINPYMHKSSGFNENRVASLGHFSIFYKVTSDSIIITSFWDNRQDPKKLLKSLKDNH